MSEESKPISPLQLFAVSYLYSEELKMDEKEQNLDSQRRITHHSYSSFRKPIVVTVREIATKIPPDAVSHIPRVQDILDELLELEQNQYLEVGFGGIREEYTQFSITTDGIILVKNIFASLSISIEDKKEYDKAIDQSKASKPSKEWLKGLWGKLKDKAQDEIADEILSGVKIYGPQVMSMVISLLNNTNH